jgi:hypothetical protein
MLDTPPTRYRVPPDDDMDRHISARIATLHRQADRLEARARPALYLTEPWQQHGEAAHHPQLQQVLGRVRLTK